MNDEGLAWAVLGVLAFIIGVLTGLFGLVSTWGGHARAPVAGAIVAFCGVVIIISMVAYAIETGEIPGGRGIGWLWLGVPFIAAGLGLAFYRE